MVFVAAYIHDLSYKVPHIDPDPMEFRVKKLKSRIAELEYRLGLKKEIAMKPVIKKETKSEYQLLREKLMKFS
tara:strand:- start:121 stop:339 length:219 start_codon:yes stop_codon:yes gene_type:complete